MSSCRDGPRELLTQQAMQLWAESDCHTILVNLYDSRGLTEAGFPHTELDRSQGTCPYGVTLLPWAGGKCLVWDATFTDGLVEIYRTRTAEVARAAAILASDRNTSKYTAYLSSNCSVCWLFETQGLENKEGL